MPQLSIIRIRDLVRSLNYVVSLHAADLPGKEDARLGFELQRMIDGVGDVLDLEKSSQIGEGTKRLQVARPRRQILSDFDVRGLVQLNGQELARRTLQYPDHIEGIRIERKLARFHALHAVAWTAKDGEVVAEATCMCVLQDRPAQ